MGAMFTSLFAALIAFFSAAQKLGGALENLATVAEETSGAYVDEARSNRELALIQAANKRQALRQAMGLPEQQQQPQAQLTNA